MAKIMFKDDDYMLWILFSQTRNMLFKIRKNHLAEFQISPRQAGVLLLSEATRGDVNLYQLSKWSGMEHHTISELAKRMEKNGLIERVRLAGVRKPIRLQLTEKGRQLANSVRGYGKYREIWSCLSKEERKQLKSILFKIREQALRMLRISGDLPFPPYRFIKGENR